MHWSGHSAWLDNHSGVDSVNGCQVRLAHSTGTLPQGLAAPCRNPIPAGFRRGVQAGCGGFSPFFAPGMAFMPGTRVPAGLGQNLAGPEDRQDRPPAIRVLLSRRHRQSGHTACTLPVINRLHLRRSGQPRAGCCRTTFAGNSMSTCNVADSSMVFCGCAVPAVMLNPWSPLAAPTVGASGDRRGLFPSCGARLMAESAALLVDEVFPHEPKRQWVLCVRFPLGFLFASQPKITGKALGIVYRYTDGNHDSGPLLSGKNAEHRL